MHLIKDGEICAGTMQDVVIGSKGSSTLFHKDSPVPIASTILVVTGVKEVSHILS